MALPAQVIELLKLRALVYVSECVYIYIHYVKMQICIDIYICIHMKMYTYYIHTVNLLGYKQTKLLDSTRT